MEQILSKEREEAEKHHAQRVYERARKAWSAFEVFRRERNRCKRYVFGQQLSDTIEVNGRVTTEHDFILEMGQRPLQNNLLRRILRNVTGVYRANYDAPTDERINKIFKANRMAELSPRLLEEFLISGMTVVKFVATGGGESRSYDILPVTPDNFFLHSDGYDPRGRDVDLIGEVHNVSFSNLAGSICRTADEYRRLESLFGHHRELDMPCRVMEVWYKTSETWGLIHDEKRGELYKMSMDDLLREMRDKRVESLQIRSCTHSGWRCAWYADDGTLLKSGPAAERHPYIWKAYPFLDGEVHSYVNDIIDQQRYVNHLITLYDFIMRSSAKGVLLFPDESIPRGWSLSDVAEHWSKFNGVIPYRAQPGVPLPTQVSGNAANIGISELLRIEMQMLEDISGVSPTLQGKLVNTSATSGTLFAQQNQAAMTSLLDVIRSFEEFIEAMGAYIKM